jgi:hypothetical protein
MILDNQNHSKEEFIIPDQNCYNADVVTIPNQPYYLGLYKVQ